MLVPEVVKTNWWQFVLQNYRCELLRSALLRHGDHRLVVVSVPWYVVDPMPTQAGVRPAAAPKPGSGRRQPATGCRRPRDAENGRGCCRPQETPL